VNDYPTTDPLGGSDEAARLDHPVWTSLIGPHSHLAERREYAARYPPDLSRFVALSPGSGPRAWEDLSDLVGPGRSVVLAGTGEIPPGGWEVRGQVPGVQMIDTGLQTADDPDAAPLTAADVPEMLELVAQTRPGPFGPRTIELGTYLGIRRNGVLIAMAGERFHPPGWTEISAVCTDAASRGQGLATRLVRAVAAGIRSRGETPFLHAARSNTNAIRLYESLGFTTRRTMIFQQVRWAPEG
jgi:ribosomal protein S18 acetylase RimI-like enzyme